MASFYNNYYRYYRPYSFPTSNHHYSALDKAPDNDTSDSNSQKETSSQTNSKKNNSSRYYSFGPLRFNNPIFDDIENPIFEILGIQLYLDDIIILGLLFFLYQEGVQDEMLFIALILLLLT